MKTGNSFSSLFEEIIALKVPFVLVFFVIVMLTYGVLYALDFIPEPVTATEKTQEVMNDTQTALEQESVFIEEEVAVSPLPLKIIFDSLNKEVNVLNPESREIADLDEALLSGVVRHPDSATFEEDGNIFILGHSSYLPNVFNKNYQAFNGIQSLAWGDTIRLQSEDTEYVYRVQKVYEAKASEVFVPETPGKAQLTLATCDSFGSKDDRFIVEAMLLTSRPL
jgi:LPXTG-site transpeptidase (sortase) family protein